MLKLKDISVRKNGNTILEHLSLKISPGDKMLVKGESGSGKSTLLKTVLFFEKFTGEILFNDTPVTFENMNEYRRHISYIGQEPLRFSDSVHQFLMIPFAFKSNSHKQLDKAKLKKYFKIFQFNEDILERDYNALSGGEKQRISLIQILMLDKKIIIIDEITSALDERNKIKVIEEILKIEDLTLLIASHDAEWSKFTNKIMELEKCS